MNLKWMSSVCIVVAVGLIGVGVFQLTDSWRRPSIGNVKFEWAIPADAAAKREYTVPLTIRNDNDEPITIFGEYTC